MSAATEWVRNPAARIRRIVRGEDVVAFQVFAPVPRQGLRITKVEGESTPAFQVLRRLTEPRQASDEVQPDEMAELVRLGVLVTSDTIPATVHLPHDLIESSTPGDAAIPASLHWNPGLQLHEPGQPPPAWPFAIPDGRRLLLAPDPRTGVAIPSLVDAHAPWLQAWQRGEPAAEMVCPSWPRLREAGVVVSTDETAWSWSEEAQHFASEGYVVLRDVLPPALLALLKPYYRGLVEQGHLPRGDGQSDRYAAHNERMARWIHLELERALRLVAPGHKASYSYLGSYVAGAILARHTDREQCGLTASVCIDEWGADPSFHWPLGLEDRQGRDVQAVLLPGDALLFRGTELPHYRERLPDGAAYTSIFFHFVDESFEGSLN